MNALALPASRLLIFLLPLLAAASALHAELRTFTSADGERTLKAQLTDFSSDGTVSIRTEDGRIFTNLDPQQFSPEDRQYIRNWMVRTVFERDDLEIKLTQKREKIGEREKGGWELTTFSGAYQIVLENDSMLDLSGLTLEYALIKWNAEIGGDQRAGEESVHLGMLEVKHLPARGKLKLETGKVPLTEAKLLPNFYIPDGGTSSPEDSLRGCWLRVHWNGALMMQLTQPDGLMKDTSWKKFTRQ